MSEQPIRIDRVFDDPSAVRALVKRHGPYRAMASYLSDSDTRGERATTADSGTLPWFRATWAVKGQPLVDGVAAILENARFREAASRLFQTTEVTPNTVVVNVNAPMPAGAIHVDIPSFQGADRDRYPIKLLRAMGASGLFEPWRIVEAGEGVALLENETGMHSCLVTHQASPVGAGGKRRHPRGDENTGLGADKPEAE